MARSPEVANVLADSGAWIALLSARDQHHAQADALIRKALLERVSLLTTNLVLAEVHRFLLFRVGIQAARVALDRIEASKSVRLVFATEAHHHAARTWMVRLGDQRISYTDAVSFAVMTAARCRTVLGFDHDFLVAGFRFWGQD